MKIRFAFIFLLITYCFSLVAHAQPPTPATRGLVAVKSSIESLIAASGAEVVSLAVYDLATKQGLFINERSSLHAASTMKLPVMMEIFRLAQNKRLDLKELVEVRNEFHSIIDGSPYQLSAKDDSDDGLYGRIGQKLPLIELVEPMITRSSNLATNLLIERVGPTNVNRLMRSLGARDIQVLRGVEDAKAFQAGRNNTTTAYDLMLLLRLIAENKFLNRQSCERMVAILAAQEFNRGIPAGLPAGTRVAHKTGEITRHNHDAAIVYPTQPSGRPPYVLVVLTKGIPDTKVSSRLIADISAQVYRALVDEH